MTTCTVCERKSQLFLCFHCIVELRTNLAGLPRFLTHLSETAYGQTKLGDDSRHSRARIHHLDGDAEVDSFGPRALAAFLATGRCNLKALRLCGDATTIISTWVRHLCETRSLDVPAGTDAVLCAWLARNVNAIAADEAAQECYSEIHDLIERIEHVINAPVPPRLCGPCPYVDEMGIVCGTRLTAPARETTVRCPQCDTVHDIATLTEKLLADAEYFPLSVRELSVALSAIGRPVPIKTIYRWTYEERLTVVSHRDGKPLFNLADARRLSERKSRHAV